MVGHNFFYLINSWRNWLVGGGEFHFETFLVSWTLSSITECEGALYCRHKRFRLKFLRCDLYLNKHLVQELKIFSFAFIVTPSWILKGPIILLPIIPDQKRYSTSSLLYFKSFWLTFYTGLNIYPHISGRSIQYSSTIATKITMVKSMSMYSSFAQLTRFHLRYFLKSSS